MSSEIKKLIIEDAAFYDAQMNDVKLRLWAEQLADLSPADVREAMFKLRSEGHRFQPMPAEIRKAIRPEMKIEAEAQVAVGRIFEAIRTFGYMQAAKAREFVGDLGWSAVQAYGGWENLCCSQDLGSYGTVRAQLRDYCEAALLRARQGRSNVQPGMIAGPEPKRLGGDGQEAKNRVLDLATAAVKGMD